MQTSYIDFWEKFCAFLTEAGDFPLKILTHSNRYSLRFGSKHLACHFSVRHYKREKQLRLGLRVRSKNSKKYVNELYTFLARNKNELKKHFDEDLCWYNPALEGKKLNTGRANIDIIKDGVDLENRASWDELMVWMKDRLEKFDKVFTPELEKFALSKRDKK